MDSNSSQGERSTVVKAGRWKEDVLRSVPEKPPATKDGKRDSKRTEPDAASATGSGGPGIPSGHHLPCARYLWSGHRGQRHGGPGGHESQAHEDPHELLPGESGGS